MNKLVNCCRLNSVQKIPINFHLIRFLSALKNADVFNVQATGIKSSLKKTTKHESFVFRSFFGEFDPDYLRLVTEFCNLIR